MPTQANYDHIKNELLQAKLKISQLEKQIEEYKKLKKVSFDDNIDYDIKDISPDPQLVSQHLQPIL